MKIDFVKTLEASSPYTPGTIYFESNTGLIKVATATNQYNVYGGVRHAEYDVSTNTLTIQNGNGEEIYIDLDDVMDSKIPKVSNPTTDNFASFNSDGTIKDSGHSHSDYITSIKTVNNESLVGTGNIVVSGLPLVSAADNGKILMVVNGQWQLVSPSVLYSGSGVPNNANGNNGDLYMQTD